MAGLLSKALAFFKSAKAKPKTTAETGLKEGDTFSPEIFNPYYDTTLIRSSGNVDQVIRKLQQYDPDGSNGIWSVLRFADTPIDIYFINDKGDFDADKTKQFLQVLDNSWLASVNEQSPRELANTIMMRLFMFGGVGLEVILNELKMPTRFITVKTTLLEWRKKGGKFYPFQKKQGKEISLDIPTFFHVTTDQHPDEATADSPLLPAVQAIAFKQAVITDIQRVVKKAGYPRLKVTILEEVLRKNAPASVRQEPTKLAAWLKAQKTLIAQELAKIKPEEAVVIFDSIEIESLNKEASKTVDFRPIIEILDGQITSSLKVLPSILGKSSGGGGSQNIASVESMVFLNTPRFLQTRADKIMSQAYTISARLLGFKGSIMVKHRPINLRPEIELEPQMLAKQNRVLQLLSFGLITDSEAALELNIYHLPKEELSGTRFLDTNPNTDTENISPNDDPQGRSITGGDGAGDTRGNESSS